MGSFVTVQAHYCLSRDNPPATPSYTYMTLEQCRVIALTVMAMCEKILYNCSKIYCELPTSTRSITSMLTRFCVNKKMHLISPSACNASRTKTHSDTTCLRLMRWRLFYWEMELSLRTAGISFCAYMAPRALCNTLATGIWPTPVSTVCSFSYTASTSGTGSFA